MMTTKFTTTLLGLAAGLTLLALPQAAQAQNSIAITGGTLTQSDGSGPSFPISFTTSSQGTFTGNVMPIIGIECTSICDFEVYGKVSGSGFSPTGPVLFSNVPIVIQIVDQESS
ncbi:MAG: hypothetical protein EA366_01880, partial [Spirulina sp. DLM2.Bin59]